MTGRLLVLLCCTVWFCFGWREDASGGDAGGGVAVSFEYSRQSGFSSNQFAVWVEDAAGNVVKTLYVTSFTAEGGWRKRDQALPLWVKKSGVAEMPAERIDAISGATPKFDAITYFWDMRDEDGRVVPAGTYTTLVEATLRGDNRVLYKASITLGGEPAVIEPTPEYFGSDTAERGMIAAVRVRTMQ